MDRRGHGDRRATHVLFTDWRYSLAGRRRTPRRVPDARSTGVDVYERPVFWMAVSIVVLSCLDATFTLILMREGIVEEWNPLMAILIADDVQLFANLKTAITGAAVILMVACYHGTVLGRVPVRWIFKGIVGGYALLITYEIALLLTH